MTLLKNTSSAVPRWHVAHTPSCTPAGVKHAVVAQAEVITAVEALLEIKFEPLSYYNIV